MAAREGSGFLTNEDVASVPLPPGKAVESKFNGVTEGRSHDTASDGVWTADKYADGQYYGGTTDGPESNELVYDYVDARFRYIGSVSMSLGQKFDFYQPDVLQKKTNATLLWLRFPVSLRIPTATSSSSRFVVIPPTAVNATLRTMDFLGYDTSSLPSDALLPFLVAEVACIGFVHNAFSCVDVVRPGSSVTTCSGHFSCFEAPQIQCGGFWVPINNDATQVIDTTKDCDVPHSPATHQGMLTFPVSVEFLKAFYPDGGTAAAPLQLCFLPSHIASSSLAPRKIGKLRFLPGIFSFCVTLRFAYCRECFTQKALFLSKRAHPLRRYCSLSGPYGGRDGRLL